MDAGNASRPTSRAFRGKTLGRITGAQSLRQFDAVDEARALNVAALNSFRGFGHHDGTRPQRIRVDRDCRCARSLHPPDRWGRHCTAAMVIVSRCFISPSEQVPKQWSASSTLDHGQPGPAGGFLAGRGKHNSTRASTGAVAHVTRTCAEDKGSRPGVEVSTWAASGRAMRRASSQGSGLLAAHQPQELGFVNVAAFDEAGD